ncbi:MAG TPA: nucleoside phosphorylase [Myxococcota bacterium]|nr:nucleoside phosphorylase [Myxococcota bacterium]
MSEEPGQPITGLRRGAVGENVFLCGDPARVPRIAKGWANARDVLNLREYRIAVGERDGVRLAAASTGIGAPSTAILVEELAKIGAKRFIRVGNSGGLQPALGLGDLVITTGAVRDDGTSRAYVLPEYPAVADWRVVSALVTAARARGVRHTVGLTWSLDAFYARNAVLGSDGAIESMTFAGFRPPELEARLVAMRDARVQNCEMESGILLTLAQIFGLEAGCICVVSDRAPWPGPAELDIDKNMDACIAVATDAMLALAKTL